MSEQEKEQVLMIKAKVLRVDGNSAAVSFRDEEGAPLMAVVVPNQQYKVGRTVDIEADTLLNGTEYGIDWSTLLPDTKIVLDLKTIEQAFRQQDIWTREDLVNNPEKALHVVRQAANRIVSAMQTAAANQLR